LALSAKTKIILTFSTTTLSKMTLSWTLKTATLKIMTLHGTRFMVNVMLYIFKLSVVMLTLNMNDTQHNST
jgi:hypothetical protein